MAGLRFASRFARRLEPYLSGEGRTLDLGIHPYVHPGRTRCMRHGWKTLTTMHGRLDLPDLPPVLREFAMMPLVSISTAQRAPMPWANWYGTVYHGMPRSLYAAGSGDGGYLAFI